MGLSCSRAMSSYGNDRPSRVRAEAALPMYPPSAGFCGSTTTLTAECFRSCPSSVDSYSVSTSLRHAAACARPCRCGRPCSICLGSSLRRRALRSACCSSCTESSRHGTILPLDNRNTSLQLNSFGWLVGKQTCHYSLVRYRVPAERTDI